LPADSFDLFAPECARRAVLFPRSIIQGTMPPIEGSSVLCKEHDYDRIARFEPRHHLRHHAA